MLPLNVSGNALDEDFGRLNLASLDSELLPDSVDSGDMCSPLSASFSGTMASKCFKLQLLLCTEEALFACSNDIHQRNQRARRRHR